MKIAHIISTFPPKIGGMGEVCRAEAEILSASGKNVTVFTLRYPGQKAHDEGNFFIERLMSWFRLGDGGLVPQLLARLGSGFDRIRDYNVLHLHYPFYGGAEWVYLASKIFKIPYVVTYHMDAVPTGWFACILQFIYDAIWARAILRGAKKVITLDRDHLKSVRFGNIISPQKVVEINNSVDEKIFNPTIGAPPANWPVHKKVILFVGNFIRFKRFDLLLFALKNLPSEAVVVAVGDGYEKESYMRQAQNLGLGDRVIFWGRVTGRSVLQNLYVNSAVVAVPADRGESFSLVALEALACGVPVVAANLPGVAGRIEDGKDGYLFTPGDEKDLGEKISRILNLSSEERRVMGERARAKILAHYTWAQHLTKLLALYKEVL